MPTVLPSPFPFDETGRSPVPSQSRKYESGADSTYGGELRLYYGFPQLRPKSSTYGLTRIKDGKPHPHSGIDIFAPAWDFPREIPVVAVSDGRALMVFEAEEPNDIGNRVKFVPKGMPNDQINYGHLSRFEGYSRNVVAGEIIGYVGCTGNAASGTTCRTPGHYSLVAAHVHMAWYHQGSHIDPLPKLGFNLRFADDLTPKEEADWKDDALTKPLVPAEKQSLLEVSRLTSAQRWPRPVRYADNGWARFDNLEVANRKAMSSTLRCYTQAADRWAETTPGAQTVKDREAALAAFNASLEVLGGDLVQRLRSLANRLAAYAADWSSIGEGDTDLPSEEEIRRVHVLLAEVMFLGVEAIWHGGGGPAIAASGRNRNTNTDPERTAVPDGAFGLNGTSYVHEFDQGIAALHFSLLTKSAATQPPERFSDWTLMVGFGAGSGRHAVLDARLGAIVTKKTKEAFEALDTLINAQRALATGLARRPPPTNLFRLTALLNSREGVSAVQRVITMVEDVHGKLSALTGDEPESWIAALAATGRDALVQADRVLLPTGAPPHLRRHPNDFITFRLVPHKTARSEVTG